MAIQAQKLCKWCGTTTTSSTTTTSTTLSINIQVNNQSSAGSITLLNIGGSTPIGITLPIGPGQTAQGHSTEGSFVSATIQIGGTWGSFVILDSSNTYQCNNFNALPFATFIDIDDAQPVQIIVANTSCTTTTTTTSTTSTTTTSTTTLTVGFTIFNDSNNTITGARSNGFTPVGITFPIGPGDGQAGTVPANPVSVIEVDVTFDVPDQSIQVNDASAGNFCQNVTSAGTYTFPALDGSASGILSVTGQFSPCP